MSDDVAMKRHGRLAFLLLVAVVGLNLRPFLTGVGPLAAEIGGETGLGLQGLAMLTLVPMLLMGCFAFAGPWLQRRCGARPAMIAALALLALGSFLRLYASAGWMLLATAVLLGLGAAVVQAIFPGVMKGRFPRHVPAVMGLYASMLMGGGAVGAQLAPFFASISGSWHSGLAWMALPAILALLMAVRILPRAEEGEDSERGGTMALLRPPRTWLLMACFSLVNGGYSSAVAWMAPAYRALGWNAAASGSLIALMACAQAATALLLPMAVAKVPDRRSALWLTLGAQVAGFSGLAFWPQLAPVAWAMLAGAGLGGCFALMMIVALEHLPGPREAGALSALMQGGGFLIASIPPWLVAVLHDRTGGFQAGWMFHIGCVAVVSVLTVRLAPWSYADAMKPSPGITRPAGEAGRG